MTERKRNRWLAVIALGVAAAAFGVITVGGIGENLVYYWGPTDIVEAGDKAIGATIRLGGQVADGSIRTGGGASGLEFQVTDGSSTIVVRSHGVPPQMFREGIGVVVEGTMTPGGWFASQRLMVSHGNEYRAPGEGKPSDIQELMKTTEGLPAADAR
ncbi:MAG TPA: cytochrome c maturation protein CcmE [Thermoanaerobaculia bacterium]|nr:cytochrome c maturation protein CcmE [Thermoanaerobaculia bacterium]